MLKKINSKTYIIAEIGVNHNGSLILAKKLIKEAKKSGADAVKFQNFKADNLTTKKAKQAPYQVQNTKKKEEQYKMLKRLELPNNYYFILKRFAQKNGIHFISSVFDEESVDFLVNKLKNNLIKVPSGEITNILLLKKLNINKYRILLSTGMSNYEEIIDAINVIARNKVFKFQKQKVKLINPKILRKIRKNLCIMHCVTNYPVEDKQANLGCIENMISDFKLDIGYSDHTKGTMAPVLAVSKGAKIIEKHFTLNKKMSGPDHLASLEPKEFKLMVSKIRLFETMLGDGNKRLQKCEIPNLKIARKSIVAKKLIKKNEKFTYENLTVKRPGTGLSPFLIEKILNKKSTRKFFPDQIIKI